MKNIYEIHDAVTDAYDGRCYSRTVVRAFLDAFEDDE